MIVFGETKRLRSSMMPKRSASPSVARPRSNFSSVTTLRSSPRFFSLHSGEKPPKYGSR